jgi:hypothetical protein
MPRRIMVGAPGWSIPKGWSSTTRQWFMARQIRGPSGDRFGRSISSWRPRVGKIVPSGQALAGWTVVRIFDEKDSKFLGNLEDMNGMGELERLLAGMAEAKLARPAPALTR